MKKTILLFTLSLFVCSITYGQTKKDLDVTAMVRSNIYAKSSIEDSTTLGGFGPSNNSPKLIKAENQFSEIGLFLKIDTTQIVSLSEKVNGYTLFIGNKSDTIVKLAASDSRLDVIAEVFYKGKWQPIEYLPGTNCGNSYHHVFLQQNEYWQFIIPKFSGKLKTKLRYRLTIGTNKFIYSNAIETSINKQQLVKKEGKGPNGMID